MGKYVSAIGALVLLLASPALAHAGPHAFESAGAFADHMLRDGYHVTLIVGFLVAFLAGLGTFAVVRSARGGFRR
jgi:hypothetical protein